MIVQSVYPTVGLLRNQKSAQVQLRRVYPAASAGATDNRAQRGNSKSTLAPHVKSRNTGTRKTASAARADGLYDAERSGITIRAQCCQNVTVSE